MNRTLIPLCDCETANCGGKAAGLARLIACGVAVPSGSCLTADVYHSALPKQRPAADVAPRDVPSACSALVAHLERWQPDAALTAQLRGALEQLGPTLAVRSSASCEDLAGQSSAGVFDSVLDVTELDGLIRAIRRCWSSLWSVPAWVTLRARGSWPAVQQMAVLLQRQVPATRGGIALSHAPGADDALLVESVAGRPASLAQGDVDPERLFPPREGALDPATRDLLGEPVARELRRQILAGANALGGPVEVEWVVDPASRVWLVQARADTASLGARAPDGSVVDPPIASAARDGTVWRWDREHNPEPLSPAHASLVAHVDQQLAGLVRLRVHGGYLYEARKTSPENAIPAPEIGPELTGLRGLVQRARNEQPTQLDARLTHAIDAFVAFNRRYIDRLGRSRRLASRQLHALLQERLDPTADVDLMAATISQGTAHDSWQRAQLIHEIAKQSDSDAHLRSWLSLDESSGALPQALEPFVERYGSLAPSWDVATPTFAEHPALLKGPIRGAIDAPDPPSVRIARASRQAERTVERVGDTLDEAGRQQLTQLVEQAREARDSAEDDDLLFAQALWLIRSALLACADHLVENRRLEHRQQVFGLGIELIRAELANGCGPNESLSLRAERGLATWRQQRNQVPPLTIQNGRPRWSEPPAGQLARGLGIGGVARGRARLIRQPEQLFEQDLRGAVVICPTLTPALAAVLPQLSALVTDHGGLLSHAACLAREFGLPAVIGTRSGTRLFEVGDLVWVDGPRGLAVKV